MEPRQTWTFARADDRLVLRRQHTDQGLTLVVIASDRPPTTIPFNDLAALNAFQADMEEVLVHTGWSLVGFEPDRRRRDRRNFPRVENDRRRWWTDPAPEQSEPVAARGGKSRRKKAR